MLTIKRVRPAEKILALSAAHIPFEDMRQLDEREPPIKLEKLMCGWRIGLDAVDTEGTFLSPAFQRVLDFAKRQGFTKVEFDTDLPVEEGLPTYEWGPYNVQFFVLREIYRTALAKDKSCEKALESIRAITLEALGELGYSLADLGMCLSCGGGPCACS